MAYVPPSSDRNDIFGVNSRFGGKIEPEKPKGNFLTRDRTMTVKYNPWRSFKRIVGIVLLVSVFLVGSWMSTAACSSTDPSMARWCFSPFDSSSSLTGASIQEEPAVQTAPVEVAPLETVPVVAEATPPVTETVEEPAVVPVKEEVKAQEKQEEPEVVVTKYSNKVILTLDMVKSTSMGTWGKVDRLDVSIANQEPGTVIPYKLVMIMEGYDKRTKDILIPENIASITSGKMIRPSLAVEGGFSYSEAQVGELATVRIDLTLVDKAGKVIASTSRDVKLN
ncbi:hypothetical protein HYV86_00480 [Candidatus Woesearchaeota archaeon]|nr:hypothetical protein [Candidatus Woesearchaeota archaeon]